MPKIVKFNLIYILAFFVLCMASSIYEADAQDASTLDNGLEVIIQEDHRNALVVFSVFIDGGSISEDEYLGSGVSHLIEHMLFKGTAKYTGSDIKNILHKYGGDIDAFTSYDYTGFRITILKEHAYVALDILKEMLSAPLFEDRELKKEKEVIEREMDLSHDSPAKRLSDLTFENAYIRHPYHVPIIGYKENFKRLGQADVMKFFKENYTPENMVLACVGDIDAAEMATKIKELFGGLPRGDNKLNVLPVEPQKIMEKYAEEKMDVEGAYLNIAFSSTSLLDKDLYSLDILSFILGNGESSILNKEVRLKQKLVLSISSYNYTPKDRGLFIISSVLKEEELKKAIQEILGQIDFIKKNGITDEQLERAKNNFLAAYIYDKETIESKANDLALGELLTGSPRFFEYYIEKIKAVTKEDIMAAADKYLNRDNMTVVALTRAGNILKAEPVKATSSQKKEVERIVLGNGLTLLISQNSHLPMVSITLALKGGLRLETEEVNGISRLSSLMLLDGTKSMTREKLTDLYESKGMSVSTYSGNNSITISITCLKEHIEDALRILSELCLESDFPETEFEREREETKVLIDMQDDQIFNQGHRLLKGLLFKQHPYRFQDIGTYESMAKIKRDDVERFFKKLLSTDNMVLGVSGDFDKAPLKPLVEKYFSKVPSTKAMLGAVKKEPPMDSVRELVIDTDKRESLVLFGFRGIDIFSKDRYALGMIINILSSQSGILFDAVREKTGLSYAQGALQVLGIDPGYVLIYTLTQRQHIDAVKDIILKEIKKIIENGVSDEDLEKSKQYLKSMRQVALQTNASFIFTASLDELYGLGYDNYMRYDTEIDKVSLQDIKRVASQIFDLNRHALLILKGKE